MIFLILEIVQVFTAILVVVSSWKTMVQEFNQDETKIKMCAQLGAKLRRLIMVLIFMSSSYRMMLYMSWENWVELLTGSQLKPPLRQIFPWAIYFEKYVVLKTMPSSTSNLWKMIHIQSTLLFMMSILKSRPMMLDVCRKAAVFFIVIILQANKLNSLPANKALKANCGELLILWFLIFLGLCHHLPFRKNRKADQLDLPPKLQVLLVLVLGWRFYDEVAYFAYACSMVV